MKDDGIEWANRDFDWTIGYDKNLSYAVTPFGTSDVVAASELICDIQSLVTAQEYV